jgi:drug/metabolite transporter (DMT)-like permease
VSKNVAYGLMALAAVLWATNGIFSMLTYDEGASVMQVTVIATTMTAIVLIILIGSLDPKSLRIKKKDLGPFVVFSLITGTFFALAWYACLERTGVATAVILLYLYPSMVTIASVFLLGEKLTAPKAVALPLTFIGCVLVAGAQEFEEGLSFDTIGILLGIFTALAGAVYYLWGKKFLDVYSANTVILYMTVLSLPGLFVIGAAADALSASPDTDLFDIDISASGWMYMLFIAIFPGTIAFVASMVALNHLEASKASIIASIEPVAAVIIAWLVLTETINGLQTVGVVLVFVGVVLLRLTTEKKASEEPPAAVVLEK